MPEFQILDASELTFHDEEPQTPQAPLKVPVERVTSHNIQPPTKRSVSTAGDYRPTAAANARIYEVVIETVTYNKSGTKIDYSHTIKYPGHKEFFDE